MTINKPLTSREGGLFNSFMDMPGDGDHVISPVSKTPARVQRNLTSEEQSILIRAVKMVARGYWFQSNTTTPGSYRESVRGRITREVMVNLCRHALNSVDVSWQDFFPSKEDLS